MPPNWHVMPQNSPMVTKNRTSLTSLERLERQLQAITPDRAQGDAWEKALKGWINAGGSDSVQFEHAGAGGPGRSRTCDQLLRRQLL